MKTNSFYNPTNASFTLHQKKNLFRNLASKKKTQNINKEGERAILRGWDEGRREVAKAVGAFIFILKFFSFVMYFGP